MIFKLFKNINNLFKSKTEKILLYNADFFPELYLIDFELIEKEINRLEKDIIWDYELRDKIIKILKEITENIILNEPLDLYSWLYLFKDIFNVKLKYYDPYYLVKIDKNELIKFFLDKDNI